VLGNYSQRFGVPQFSVLVKEGDIQEISVIRGAPCGATWQAAQEIIGCKVHDGPIEMGLKSQIHCVADPSAWDPISGKSPVHIAGELHCAALKTALMQRQDPPALF
jgi:thymidylate synthase